uniref:Signal peptidase complex subunit 3 n=1 Tax=Apteryx owenii TaxID=8824 RepID=A0A8B9P2W7_APTOW
MNTVLSRANSLFAFSLSVMAALTFGCFITTAFKERSVPVSIAVSRVVLKNVEDFTGPRERSDLGFVTFDITADLQSIFDWNVKQLFLYLSAEYSTKNNALNQVVLWDKIILRGDNPRLFLKDMKSKYFFFDDGNGLKGNRNVTLTLSWNVVPNAGILPLVTGLLQLITMVSCAADGGLIRQQQNHTKMNDARQSFEPFKSGHPCDCRDHSNLRQLQMVC